MKLTRRGFIGALTALPFAPEVLPAPIRYTVAPRVDHVSFVHPDVYERFRQLYSCDRAPLLEPPLRELTLFKPRAVGPTVGALDAASMWAALEVERSVFDNIRCVGASSYASDLHELARLIRLPSRVRPDLIVVDGIGYGPKDALPPPFGNG